MSITRARTTHLPPVDGAPAPAARRPVSRARKALRTAGAPSPPEDSVELRLAAALAVIVGVLSCLAAGEVGASVAAVSATSIAVGSIFSYLTRRRPWVRMTPLLTVAAIAVFVWFAIALGRATAGDAAASVGHLDGLLAILFIWIQVIHSFDLPSRRDLAFSLAGSATLIVVGATRDPNAGFAIYVASWTILCAWGLSARWASMAGSRSPAGVGAVGIGVASLATAMVLLAILPPPSAHSPSYFPFSLGAPSSMGPTGANASITGPGAGAGGQSHASSKIGIGGYLGFAGPLDTAIRAPLSKTVVMYVRATKPSFWTAETYSHWSGRSWTSPPSKPYAVRSRGTAVNLEPLESDVPLFSLSSRYTVNDLQTFTLAKMRANLIFAAEKPTELWVPAHKVLVDPGGAISSPVTMGPGTVYSVLSQLNEPSPAYLRRSPGNGPSLAPPEVATYTQLPTSYRRVRALAMSITRGRHSLYGKVMALENWMARHLHYSTSIPPLPPGHDAVNTFLFQDRTGYCEQISTALAVMLRTLGVPTREAVGYVPGSYDALTGLYTVTASDAHAWVQVWFPGVGWLSFDPTARIPQAAGSPAGQLIGELDSISHDAPLMAALAALCALAVALKLRRTVRAKRASRRKVTWSGAMSRRLERAGAHQGVPRSRGETLSEYSRRLDRSCAAAAVQNEPADHTPPLPPPRARHLASVAPPGGFESFAALISQDAYAPSPLDDAARAQVQVTLRRLRSPAARARIRYAVRPRRRRRSQ